MSSSRNPAKESFIDRHQLWPFYRRRRYCDETMEAVREVWREMDEGYTADDYPDAKRSGDHRNRCGAMLSVTHILPHRSRFSTLSSNHLLYPRAILSISESSSVAYSFHTIPISDRRFSRASSSVLPDANRSASSFPRMMPFPILSIRNTIGSVNLNEPTSDIVRFSDSVDRIPTMDAHNPAVI